MIDYLIVITSIYSILILLLVYGFHKVAVFKSQHKSSKITFSILIPFRNEADNLPTLLKSLSELEYPKDQFECILIDDDSEDDSVKVIHHHLENANINYRIIDNHRKSISPKKDAIATAIQTAQFDWIITTDADCVLPKNWLKEFGWFATVQDSKMIVGPVTYQGDKSFLSSFQLLDFLSLQGATVGGFGIASPFLCNGANLAYKKETFLEVNGFQGNDTVASGDDIFLFEKFYKHFPNGVHFLKSKSATVTTFPLKSWEQLINQRMRWAAKSSSYTLIFGKFVGLLVLFMNFSVIISWLGIPWHQDKALVFISIIIIKIAIDFFLIKNIASFYIGDEKKIKGYVLSSVLYPFFSVFIFFKTLFSKYTWKGRMFKK